MLRCSRVAAAAVRAPQRLYSRRSGPAFRCSGLLRRQTGAEEFLVVASKDVLIRKRWVRPGHAAAAGKLVLRRLDQLRPADLFKPSRREACDEQFAALVEQEVALAVLDEVEVAQRIWLVAVLSSHKRSPVAASRQRSSP